MKFLTVCMGGNVRSAAMAWELKDAGQDAIPIGVGYNSEATINMLCEWADYIVIMHSPLSKYIEPRFGGKFRIVDVGQDTYGTSVHPELRKFLRKTVEQWKLKDFKI